jgi:hypothetical protein
MNYFTITSTKEVIESIENFFKSRVYSAGRSLKLKNVNHYDSYSVAAIEPSEKEGKIKPEDIFWLGRWAAFDTAESNQKPNQL